MELTSALALTDEDELPQDSLIASHALRTAAVQQRSTFSKGPAISPRLLKQAVSANAQPLPNTNFCLRAMRQASEVGLGKLSKGLFSNYHLDRRRNSTCRLRRRRLLMACFTGRCFLSCRCHCKSDG